MDLAEDVKTRIDTMVRADRVVLFMKGSRARPQCGFSGSVVDVLDGYLDHYATVDVLSDPEVRDAIKEYSDWPTIPQLYVDGEFVGGADIVKEMHANGELGRVLGSDKANKGSMHSPLVVDAPRETPEIVLTAAARQAIVASREDGDGPYLRLDIGLDYHHGLSFDERGPDDIVVEVEGVHIALDRDSARRAAGVKIDFLEKDGQSGFKIDNPNKGKPSTPTNIGRPEPVLATEPPAFLVTEAALGQFQGAIDGEEGEGPHGVRVTARRMGAKRVEYELDVIPESDKDETAFLVEKGGVRFYVDRMSARHLGGASIDFVETERGGGFKFKNPIVEQGWGDPRAETLERLLIEEINPSIAAHNGHVALLDLSGNAAYIEMGGGCQGCGMAAVTLQQGIHDRVKGAGLGIEHLIDVTDHAAGQNPYYKDGGGHGHDHGHDHAH
jgi:Grx4 family monothiol glutaredoxin